MEIIEKYGVVLRKLQLQDLELVRKWRNSDDVKKHMFFQDYITEEMQIQWFKKLDNDHNFYFTVEYNAVKIGLINLKNINKNLQQAESGFFIGEATYRDSTIGAQANLAILDFGFETLHLQSIIANVLNDNKPALAFNKFLGFKSLDKSNSFILLKEDYYSKTDKLKKTLNKY